MEYFPLVKEDGTVVGKAGRKECHNNTFLLHPVVHLHVFNSSGALLLQKRADNKDIQPGKWDTSVGGHVDFGEPIEVALKREVFEELQIQAFTSVFLFKYPYRSDREYELVHSFYTVYDGPFVFDPHEISACRFWTRSEIEQSIGKQVFTPNFEHEIAKVLACMI